MNHPGTIVFVEVGSPEEKVMKVTEVPESVAFVKLNGAKVPVVRVVAQVVGAQRIIVSYGADGARLSATYQSKS